MHRAIILAIAFHHIPDTQGKAMNIIKKVLINHLPNAFQVGPSQESLKNLDLGSGRDLECQTTGQIECVVG